MNKENLFSSSTEYKLNSINCNILTPLGTTDISKSSIHEVAYSQSTSDKNFANNCTGLSGYVEIKLRSHPVIGDGNLPTHLYIPKTPVFCDAVSVPVMCDDSSLNGRGFVAMHYNFVQPLFMPVETGHMERYPLTTPRDSIYGARSLLMRNGNKQTFGIATNYLFSRIRQYTSNVDENDSVYAHEADVLVSDDPSIAAKTDGLCESALYIDKIDLLKVDFNYDDTYSSPHLKIKYAVIPITGFAATSQSLSPDLDWSSKISGSQKVALIPISAAHCDYTNDDNRGGWSSNVKSEATRETKSIAIEYPARLVNANHVAAFYETRWETSIDQNSGFNEIYRDNEYSIHSAIITYTKVDYPSSYKFQFSLGIRKAGTDRTAFPSNYSPINYSESYAELPEHESVIDLSAAYPIISIDKIKSDNKGASYNIKFGIDKDDPLLSYLEYSNGCGYFIVNISCSTLESISQAYGMCGSISEHLVCENMIVKKNSVIHTASLSHLGYNEDTLFTPYDYDSKTPEAGDNFTYLEVRESGSRDENIPVHSVVSSVNTYEGNSDYIGAGDSTMHSMWDGRAISIFSPVISSDGHGETQIRQASHLLTNSKFPVIIPSAVFYNSIDTNNELYIMAEKLTNDTWELTIPYRDSPMGIGTTDDSLVIRDNEVPIFDIAYYDDPVPAQAVNNYGWYLNLLICAVETHLWLHGIKFFSCCNSPGGALDVMDKGRSYSVNTYGWMRVGSWDGALRTVYPMVGCLNFYDTPVIGTGNTPINALFSKAEIGIDISGYGMLSTPSTTYFNNKRLMLAGDTVYETISKYSRTSDLSTKYEILRESRVSRIYAIGNYLVVGTSSSVSIFAEYNQTVSIISTIPGQLMLGVSMSHDSLYFAVLNNSNIIIYEVSRDGIIPIHESSGSKAIVSNSLSLGTTVNIYNNGTLSVYSIARGQCILIAVLETTTAWSVDDIVLSSTGIETHCIAILSSGGIKIAKEIAIGDGLEEYELTSSEFVFPKLADGGYLLYGVRLIFDIEPDEYVPEHSTFNFSVKINDEIEYEIEDASVASSKTLLFDACPATYANYTISKCLVPLRGVRWLVQRIPEPIYSQLECGTIIAIHSLPGYIFVSYNDLTVAYAMYGSGASKIATVKGLLQNHPVADQNGVYFAVKRGEYIIAHMLSRDGAVPVYQTYGESATMSCEFKSGVSMAVLEEGTVYVYSIDRGNVVYKGSSNLPFDSIELVVAGCGDASQTLLRCDIDEDNSLYYKLTETPYDMDIDIESSEYHIAETQYGKPVLTGVRVEFDYINDKTFDIDIYVDDELHSTHTNLEVGRDVTIPIVPVIGEQLSYEIKNCSATVRGVKWLVYNLPLRIYDLLETELVEDIIVIGQYVFVSYNETTVVYATANGQAEIMATVVGKLMKFPAQEEGDVYFAVSKDDMVYAYHLSREGIIPVYELEGIKAVVSTEQGIGIVLSVFNGTSVSTYRLVSGNVIYLGIIESTLLSTVTNVGTYRKGDTVSVAIQTTDPLKYQTTNNVPNLDHVLKPYELESSEFIFPYINGRYLLFGVKINFDKAPLVNDPHNSFDINVYANDELHYVSTNHDVDAEVVIRFSAVPVGYAKFRIANCHQHIRSVKWLAYKLPFINETIVYNEELVVDPDHLLYEDVVVGDYETQKYRLTIIGKATEPVEIDPQNENFSLSLSEHGVYSPTLTVQPKDGVIDKDIYVKWSPLDSGLIETRIKNTYKSLLAYVTCVASAIEGDPNGELPATFTVTVGTGINEVLVQVSEATTVTPAGGTSIKIGDPTVPGEFVTTPLTLAANTDQEIYFKGAGSFTIPKRKKITKLCIGSPGDSIIICDITGMGLTYLYLGTLRRCLITGDITGMKLTHLSLSDISLIGSSRITGDITGMPLTYLILRNLGESVITGNITGMKITRLYLRGLGSSSITGDISDMDLTYLILRNLGSLSDITGDITGMKLEELALANIRSSAITGNITGMELTTLLLYNIGSSPTYGTNVLNITFNSEGIQIVGDTVFATAAEYERLIHDAAIATWSEEYVFVIESGTNDNCPNWDDVKADVATLLTKANWTTIPPAWLEDNGGTWPANWKYYTGDEEDEGDGELPATFTIPAGYEDAGEKYINFREPVTVTMTGGVTLHIDGTPYLSGEMIFPAADFFHTLTINNPGQDAGTITFGKRKHIIMLYLMNLGSSVITCDITGMGLMVLALSDIGSSVITGNITGMGLMGLSLENLGSSVAITGDISDMELMTLMLVNLSSSVAITGDITGMPLSYLHLESLSSSSVAITGDISGMELDELVLEDIGLCVITGT